MLHSANELKGHAIEAEDGRIGSVKDVYFDDARRTVRYLVADTGTWLTGRRVLLPPQAVTRVDREGRTVQLRMTRQQIEDSPSIDDDRPVSRQEESKLYRYWGYPLYWTGPYLWGAASFPEIAAGGVQPPLAPDEAAQSSADADIEQATRGDEHLRSAHEVVGYHVVATDGELGHVEDLLFDDADWSLKEIVVDTRNWWPGRHVRVPAQALAGIDWNRRALSLGMARREIEARPEVTA